jgi:hypothetical protein
MEGPVLDDALRINELMCVNQKLQAVHQRQVEIELVFAGNRTNYDHFMQIKAHVPERAQLFFTAPNFLKFLRDQYGRISCDSLLRRFVLATETHKPTWNRREDVRGFR